MYKRHGMGPIVIMFGKRSLFDCINKADPTVAAGLLGSLLGCNRESDLHLVRFSTLATSRNFNGMVRTRLLWGLY